MILARAERMITRSVDEPEGRLLGFGLAKLCRVEDEYIIADGESVEVSNPSRVNIEPGTYILLEPRENRGFFVTAITL